MTTISVIICVYNGGEFFKKNIESVGRLEIPDNTRAEFLFVDNNAVDGSKEIIKEYARKYPDTFRCLFESRPGKSYALNLGIKKAIGEIIAFTDYDTVLPEDWLLRIREGFKEHDCAALGGEDTELFCRIHNAGEKIVHYNPMLVYHQIPGKRLTKRYYSQTHLLPLLGTLYIASLYPGTSRNKTLKRLLSLPELLIKLILSGFSGKLTTHSNFHYRMKLQSVFCGFSYRLLGMNRTIKLLKLSGCNE